jgi:hypothetical protein
MKSKKVRSEKGNPSLLRRGYGKENKIFKTSFR